MNENFTQLLQLFDSSFWIIDYFFLNLTKECEAAKNIQLWNLDLIVVLVFLYLKEKA